MFIRFGGRPIGKGLSRRPTMGPILMTNRSNPNERSLNAGDQIVMAIARSFEPRFKILLP